MVGKLILALSLFFGASQAMAQENNRVNLSIAPAGLALDTVQLGAEFVVAQNLTLGLRYAHSNAEWEDVNAEGDALGIVGRFFLTDEALAGGYYLAPAVTFPNYDLTAEIDGDRGSATLDSPIYEVTVGHQWMWSNFNINLGIGVSHFTEPDTIEVARADGTNETVDVPTLLPAAELSLGWAF